jgi:hypothetical protein
VIVPDALVTVQCILLDGRGDSIKRTLRSFVACDGVTDSCGVLLATPYIVVMINFCFMI